MNLLLFAAAERRGELVEIRDRRLEHVRDILGSRPGDTLAVGEFDGQIGRGEVLRCDEDALELRVALERDPPAPVPLTLAVALPRPPSLRKLLQQATAMGVKQFLFFGSARVEKSFWQSSGLRPEALRRQLWLGLEQGRDTRLPRVAFARRFGDFCDRALPAASAGASLWVAHPEAERACPVALDRAATVVIGPEGGLLPDELERLEHGGARAVHLGDRVLRVETAVVALIARLFPSL